MQVTEPNINSKANFKILIQMILDSGIHVWYSEEEQWAYISGNGQRIKITNRDRVDYLEKVIANLQK